MLLILGQPGIGKSTLITWITANFTDRIDDILVYKFASDLKDIDWHKTRLSHRILEELGLDCDDLNGKTIILDGLDEVSIKNRREILDELFDNLIYENRIKEFSLIITCRENYVQERDRIKVTYIILQPWDETQIRSFCDVFQKKMGDNISESTIENIIESRDILGIPLILYMTLALNISIEKEGSIVDIYDKIFSLDGGIYDRCINNKKFADKHRIGEIKEQIHQISRDIAMWMFENNSEEAYISQREYQKICVNVMQKQEQNNENIKQDFLIGNFFKLVRHCEGVETEELFFVHRSIYEYFVAETIFSSVNKAIDDEFKESLACVFGQLCKGNRLSAEMLKYLKHKLKRSRLSNEFYNINDTFQLMLQEGMTYYTKEHHKGVINCELNVFVNMLEIVHFWEKSFFHFDKKITDYIGWNGVWNINLTRIDFHNADLKGINLKGVNLSGSNLSHADLSETNLSYAILIGANLEKTDLSGTFLKSAIFDEKQVQYLKQTYELKGTRVVILKSSEVISYEDYCKRKSSEIISIEDYKKNQ